MLLTLAFLIICVAVFIVAMPKNSPNLNHFAMALAVIAAIIALLVLCNVHVSWDRRLSAVTIPDSTPT